MSLLSYTFAGESINWEIILNIVLYHDFSIPLSVYFDFKNKKSDAD